MKLQQAARARTSQRVLSTTHLRCPAPLLMLMDGGTYMNTKGEACDEFGRLLRRRGAKGGWTNKAWTWWEL